MSGGRTRERSRDAPTRQSLPDLPRVSALRDLRTLFDLVKAGPRRVTDAPCQEVVETERASLASLPVLRCWPKDGGRYITLPCVFTRDPKTGTRNVGMYRLQVFDDRTLGMHWQTHKGGAEHERVMTDA